MRREVCTLHSATVVVAVAAIFQSRRVPCLGNSSAQPDAGIGNGRRRGMVWFLMVGAEAEGSPESEVAARPN
ncbi:hypothetical protein T440DRAFT_214891 [Plenodomus tracheiphilus IPT5]|uniref:Uncharacterized protein n=1 Tax=Plenodomus tracheiphilus IPT5 TaxID=1408161 RepID=A0A6A7AV97_9PLEO|nr:hypothetical protein T440DRAFT_214891 [Plenodomus tracheiphilus IPT5]